MARSRPNASIARRSFLRLSASGTRNENDQVLVCGSLPVHLADLLEQRNKAVAFLVDPIEITFVEK